MNRSSTTTRARTLAWVISLAALAGCQTIKPSWLGNSPQIKESQYAAPARMAIIWSPAVLNQAGQSPTRGFGGRAYFYDAANRPIAVEGQLVVYAYDDTNGGRDSRAADRKYAFTPEQLRSHYSPSDLGASYSIWIPWDAVGGQQAHINLVPVFTATSGQLVMGQASPNILPGHNTPQHQPHIERHSLPPPQITREPSPAPYGVQQASFQQPAQPIAPTPTRSGPETLSIRLPETMTQRLAAAGPQPELPNPSPTQSTVHAAQSVLAGQQQHAAAAAAGATAQASPPATPPAIQVGPRQAHFEPPILPVRVAPNQRPAHGPLH